MDAGYSGSKQLADIYRRSADTALAEENQVVVSEYTGWRLSEVAKFQCS